MRILVVDDEETVRRFLKDILSSLDYAVETASDGEEGLQRIRNEAFDLVISDICMPELDGLGLLEALHDMPEAPGVILLTGYGELDTAIRALNLGAYDYIGKPVTPTEIAKRVERYARERELERRLEQERIERAKAETVRKMVVTLSHELNNPMTSVMGNLSYLLHHASEEEPEDLQHVIESMNRNCQRMADLLQRLRNVEKVRETDYIAGTPMIDADASCADAAPPAPGTQAETPLSDAAEKQT
ncbi:MAG: response regulator [Planctomycetota bacterium]